MAEKVYKLFMADQREAWFQLSESEQKALLDQVGAAREKAGGKLVKICGSRWSSEEWGIFGLEEFPSVEAAQLHTEELAKINWHRYIRSTSMLGTEIPVAE